MGISNLYTMEKLNDQITLYNADCMEVMKTFKDKEFDLAIVDPPYGIGANKMTLGNGKRKIYRGALDWDSSAPSEDYFKELQRVSANQIIWGANHFISKIPLDSSCWIVWDKGTGKNDFADCELAWTSFSSPVRKYTKSWVGSNAREKGEQRMHPTQKPIGLYDWILGHYAKPGMKILDTFGGSMSSVIASYRGGYEVTCIELDSVYYEKAKKRVLEEIAQPFLFAMTPEVKEDEILLFE